MKFIVPHDHYRALFITDLDPEMARSPIHRKLIVLIIVSNASPLIILAKLSLFDLLPRLFSEIILSQEVWEGVIIKGAGLPGSIETRQASWIRVAQLANSAKLAIWRRQYPLGIGELSTLLLAMEIAADVALYR